MAKSILVATASIIFFALGIGAFIYLTTYHSAFEADQACHYAKWESYGESTNFDCDHDLETNQWLLFEKSLDKKPAKVIRRFHY